MSAAEYRRTGGHTGSLVCASKDFLLSLDLDQRDFADAISVARCLGAIYLGDRR
jgi:hypothetical protein